MNTDDIVIISYGQWCHGVGLLCYYSLKIPMPRPSEDIIRHDCGVGDQLVCKLQSFKVNWLKYPAESNSFCGTFEKNSSMNSL